MWHVHYPFLKERYIKEIKKSSSEKELYFFCQPLSTLRSAFQPINLSTDSLLRTIVDLASELVGKDPLLFVVCGMFITLF